MQPSICVIMTTSRSYRPYSILMHNSAKKVAILFALLACAFVSLAAPPAIPSADPHRFLDDIKALTTPAMEGRGAGSKGLTGAEKRELKAKQDFVPFSFSASGSAHGPLVFVGYGISADEFHYDDYAGI